MDQEQQQIHSFGKFASAEELLAAYNALQSEFTKRCQLVKKLQARLDASTAQSPEAPTDPADPPAPELVPEPAPEPCAEAVAPPPPEQPAQNAPPEQSVPTETVVTVAEVPPVTPFDVVAEIAAHADDYADALCEIPQVVSACVARYKQALLCADIGMPTVRGAAVLTPVARPRSLSDAKRIADKMLNR